jgi:signal transduction histidine kinase
MRPPIGGVRVRTTAAATAAVAIFLAVAAVAFALVQRQQLESSLVDAARQHASDVVARVARDGANADLGAGGGDQSLVQVIAPDGSVLAASPAIDGEPAVVTARPVPGQTQTIRTEELPIGDDGETFVVVAHGADSPEGPVVVVVAQSLELVEQSTAVVVTLLVIGYPIVLIGVALTSFWLVGRALRPVEAIRSRVADIEGTATLSARVPVPKGSDEITHLATTMNAMLQRLQSASETQRRFVADASHELRSPLATIRAAHEVAALHPDQISPEATTSDVLAELDRIDRLVADLLLLARADERGLTLRRVDLDLDDLVRAEAARLRRHDKPTVTLHAPPARVQGDPDNLTRAVRNLVDNAARHATSTVTIRLSTDHTSARIEIEDDGPGIPTAERERVFERFVRLDESRARTSGGTGLGLAIAREIAHAHGGSLTIEDGQPGARLVLTLPT